HLDVEVDAVEERPRDARAVAVDEGWRAAAAAGVVAEVAARAGVHGGDELEGGGEEDGAGPARDRDAALLERLPERLERVPPEPGGPMSRRLCPPAAATSRARLAEGWPRTSARSPAASGAAARRAAASTVVGTRSASPRRCATASASVSTPTTGGPPASAASAA